MCAGDVAHELGEGGALGQVWAQRGGGNLAVGAFPPLTPSGTSPVLAHRRQADGTFAGS